MDNLPSSWSLHHSLHLAARTGVTTPSEGLLLEAPAKRYLGAKYPGGLYLHQAQALTEAVSGNDVCLATPTASGKTAVFHAAALDALGKNPQARILALYPMKALAAEQEERWRHALALAGVDAQVGRIDGGVSTALRNDICKRSRVLIATPDVVHSWLLPRVGQPRHDATTRFVRGLELVIVDEAHSYTGTFGSGAAFAFRRLQHLVGVLSGRRPRFIAASATMRDPKVHLERLLGREVVVIGEDADTSQKYSVSIELLRRAEGADFHSAVADLLRGLRDSGDQFVAFFDSRKSTEQMAAILQRDTDAGDGGDPQHFDHLEDEAVLPFRAGFEAAHRAQIQARLSDGTLRGVLSTSTLELGLDLPHLKTVVLVGVPSSGTSLRQRIGRVGRSGPGRVLIVDSGSLGDALTFEKADRLLEKPLNDSTIYLENPRVQYAHAMALARNDGEHDRAVAASGANAQVSDDRFAVWPEGFLELCDQERKGQVPLELRDMKSTASDQPTLNYLLRDIEPQFEVHHQRGMHRERLGSLSHSQVMREAYPGAVYYYTGRSYRVLSVNTQSRQVSVQPCKRYFTTPMPVIEKITPQRDVRGGFEAGELTVAESDLQIWKAVCGFNERRGTVSEQHDYPCDSPVRFARPHFARTLFTTGVCLTHPSLAAKHVDRVAIAALLLEAFLIVVPLERQDVDVATDNLKGPWHGLDKATPFITLFDQASGSLRISGRLREPETLREVLRVMLQIANSQPTLNIGNTARTLSDESREAVRTMCEAASKVPAPLRASDSEAPVVERVPILLPTSRGTSASRPGATFEVHNVFMHPQLGVAYRGIFVTPAGERATQTVPVASILPIEGQVHPGYYDLETGEQVAA